MELWHRLRKFTAARVALGRAGGSLPTKALLDFRISHARARDAVLTTFDPEALAESIRPFHAGIMTLESQATNRDEYLRRPDLGRCLAEDSRARLKALEKFPPARIVVIVSDGLSTLAAMRQIPLLLQVLLPMFEREGWTLAPIVVVRHGRVAIQDEIGEALAAEMSLILLGERPGLGAHDSLGAYFTYQPRVGRTDADRNCISNIRSEGLSPEAAAHKIFLLMHSAFRHQRSGFLLKDDTATAVLDSVIAKIS